MGLGIPFLSLALTSTLLPFLAAACPLLAGYGWEFLGPVDACSTCRVIPPDFLTVATPFSIFLQGL